MPTDYPANKDVLSNPDPTDPQDAPSHSGQHSNANDAIEAIEDKVGVDDSTDSDSIDYKLRRHRHDQPIFAGEPGDDGLIFPGLSGTQGVAGATGSPGATGAAGAPPGFAGEDGDEGFFMPGVPGAAGVGGGGGTTGGCLVWSSPNPLATGVGRKFYVWRSLELTDFAISSDEDPSGTLSVDLLLNGVSILTADETLTTATRSTSQVPTTTAIADGDYLQVEITAKGGASDRVTAYIEYTY